MKELGAAHNSIVNLPFGLLKAFIMTLIPMPAMAAVASIVSAAGF